MGESVRLARVPLHGRELYVILALLLGCGVILLGDKVFLRRVERFPWLKEVSAKLSFTVPYGTLASPTLSRKRVPKCTPHGWGHQGCFFFSGEQQVTLAATSGETSSRANSEMYLLT